MAGSFSDERFRFSAQHNRAIKAILGNVLITEAPIEADLYEATDFLFTAKPGIQIAGRVRRPDNYARFRYDTTIRTHGVAGQMVERDKLVRGFGTHMFYGISADGKRFQTWTVIDLGALRAHWILGTEQVVPYHNFKNNDGTRFDAYDMRRFVGVDPPLIIASSELRLHPKPLCIGVVRVVKHAKARAEHIADQMSKASDEAALEDLEEEMNELQDFIGSEEAA